MATWAVWNVLGLAKPQPTTAQDFRDLATEEAGKREKYAQLASQAYAQRQGAQAKEYSVLKENSHQKMVEYNRMAAKLAQETLNPYEPQTWFQSWIWDPEYNLEQIDLHQLFVTEALEAAKAHLQKCRAKNMTRTKFITGWGRNSVGGIAKVKPKIVEWLMEEKGVEIVKQSNEGLVEVVITKDESCTIM